MSELLQCDGCKMMFPDLLNFIEGDEKPGQGLLLCRPCYDTHMFCDDDDGDDHDGLDPDEH